MAEEDDPEYLIEIQDDVEGSSQEEVMVILDLGGQDMPDSVAQALIHLTQNSKKPISSVHVTKAHKKHPMLVDLGTYDRNYQSIEFKLESEDIHNGNLSTNPNVENSSQNMLLTSPSDANIYTDTFSGGSEVKISLREEGNFQSHPQTSGQAVVMKDQGNEIYRQEVMEQDKQSNEEFVVLRNQGYQTTDQAVECRNQTNSAELEKPIKEEQKHVRTYFDMCTSGLNAGTRIVVKDLIHLEEFRTGKVRQSICDGISDSPMKTEDHFEIKLENTASYASSYSPDTDSNKKSDNSFSCSPKANERANIDSEYSRLKDSTAVFQTKTLTFETNGIENSTPKIQGQSERAVDSKKRNCLKTVSCEKPNLSKETPTQLNIHVDSVVLAENLSNLFCSYCLFQCQSDIDMGRHLQDIHDDQRPFRCSVCKKSFALELSFKIHKLPHGDKALERQIKAKVFIDCPHCSQSFTTTRRVKRHVCKIHAKLKVFFCNNCKTSFKSKSELKKHMISPSHLEKVNRLTDCPICHISCVRLSKHLTAKHPSYCPFWCDLCGYSCKIYSKLKNHLVSHLLGKPFQCPHCHKFLKSKVSWSRHVKNHNSEKRFSCNLCTFRSNDSYEYKRHVQRVHSKNLYFDCKFCNLSFLKAHDLKLHAMSEHNSRDTQFCTYCNFSCEIRAEMKKHRQIHTGQNPFVCDKCDFSTAFKAHLERHQTTHSNLKPFKCPDCNYSCKEKVNLKKHMVTHRPEKPFACSMCSHRSKLRSLLNSHIRIVHSSLRPYSCTQCDYTCKTLSNLKKHQWIHQGYKPFACQFCPYITCETNKLRRHENFKHKDQIGTELSSQYQNVSQTMKLSKHSSVPLERDASPKESSEHTDAGCTEGLLKFSNSLDSVAEEVMGPVIEKTFFSNGRISLARLQENSQIDSLELSMHPPQTQRFIIQYSN